MRVRFDDSPAVSQLWGESTDYDAFFAPLGVTFARRLAKTKRLRLEFTAFNSDPRVIEFDTTGFELVIGDIARQCGWKP